MSTENPRYSPPPLEFVNPNGDLILLSSDDFKFKVYKAMLSTASPVFEDMLQNPTPKAMEDNEVEEGVQVVALEERKHVITTLLQLSYPGEGPVIKSLEELQHVLAALAKYQMDRLRGPWIHKTLVSFVEIDPLAVYAIALSFGRVSCYYKPEGELKLAAKLLLRRPIGGPMPQALDLITAPDYHRAMQYVQNCREILADKSTVFDALRDNSGSLRGWAWIQPCGADRCRRNGYTGEGYACSWWKIYMQKVMEALDRRPWGGAVPGAEVWAVLMKDWMTECSACASAAVPQMITYTQKLSNVIEDRISKVIFLYRLKFRTDTVCKG